MRVEVTKQKNPKIEAGCVILVDIDDDKKPYLVISDRNNFHYRLVCLLTGEALAVSSDDVKEMLNHYHARREYTVFSPDQILLKVGVKNG